MSMLYPLIFTVFGFFYLLGCLEKIALWRKDRLLYVRIRK